MQICAVRFQLVKSRLTSRHPFRSPEVIIMTCKKPFLTFFALSNSNLKFNPIVKTVCELNSGIDVNYAIYRLHMCAEHVLRGKSVARMRLKYMHGKIQANHMKTLLVLFDESCLFFS